jgi:hypothetical protein
MNKNIQEKRGRKLYTKPELTKHKPLPDITFATQTRKGGTCAC